MTKTQKNRGFTPIRHYLLEAVLKKQLAASDLCIFFALCRVTYGWRDSGSRRQRNRARVSYSDLSALTNLDKRTVKSSMKRLKGFGIVVEYDGPQRKMRLPGEYGIEPNSSLWSVQDRPNFDIDDHHQTTSTITTYGTSTITTSDTDDHHHGTSTITTSDTDDHHHGDRKCQNMESEPNTDEGSSTPIERLYRKDLIEKKDRKHDRKQNESSESENDLSNPTDLNVGYGARCYVIIGRRWFPITGPPYAKKADCQKYEAMTADDPEFARECLRVAIFNLVRWEDENKRKARNPWSILERAYEFYQNGLPEEPPKQREAYDWTKDPDYADEVARMRENGELPEDEQDD